MIHTATNVELVHSIMGVVDEPRLRVMWASKCRYGSGAVHTSMSVRRMNAGVLDVGVAVDGWK